MRHAALLLLLAVACASRPARPDPAETGSQDPAPAPAPVAVLPETTHHAGRVRQGEAIEHIFKVENRGEGELRILHVQPG